MIRTLRRRHRVMIPALTVFGIATLLLGLSQRPAASASDGGRLPPAAAEATPVIPPAPLSMGSGIEIEVRRRPADGNTLLLGVRTSAPLPYPQGYVFWQPTSEWARVTPEAIALGPVGDGGWVHYDLPAEAETREGAIVVFSTGYGSVVDGGPLHIPPGAEPAP